MARVTISREWADGDQLHITVAVSESFPDSVAEARNACRALYADALDITLADADTVVEVSADDPDTI